MTTPYKHVFPDMPHWTTIAKFCADVDEAIALHPEKFRFTPEERAEHLERDCKTILDYYGYAPRSGKDMIQ